MKPKIGFDIDNTITATQEQALDWINERFRTSFRLADLGPNHELPEPYEGIREAQWELFMQKMVPYLRLIDGVDRILNLLANRYDLVMVTKRPPHRMDGTRTHFNRNRIPYVDIISVPLDGRKQEFIEREGLVAMVDDEYENLEGLDRNKCFPVLFGNYPWNENFHNNVVRADNWSHVYRLLLSNVH